MRRYPILAAILPASLLASSCGSAATVETEATSTPAAGAVEGFAITEHGSFDEPWAAAFIPGTSLLFVTEKPGTARIVDTASDRTIPVSGLPRVDYGGQGGLGDVAFLPSQSAAGVEQRTIYLSWVEAGGNDTRGAVVGRGTLSCETADACAIGGLEVIWRQSPKVTGRGHFSHRIAVGPDERHLFVASGERQKMQPAQDVSNTLGTIVRLDLDGRPAAGNPLADRGSPSDEIWSWGHRNILGLDFDAQGRLWEVEHGPKGGDELNRVQKGANYGWPLRSGGVHYDGAPIPAHAEGDGFEHPSVNWTPVIAPGDMTFYSGSLFPGWEGDLLIAGLKPEALIRVEFEGTEAREAARYPMDERIRSVIEGPEGALWVLEDGEGGRLLELRPR